MCDCVPSTPLTCSSIRIRKLDSVRCSSKPRICKTELFQRIGCNSVRISIRNGGFQLAGGGVDHNGGMNIMRSLKSVKVNRNSDVLGSENYDFLDGLGFEEKDKSICDFEERYQDGEGENVCLNPTTTNKIDPTNWEREDDNSSKASVSSTHDFLELKGDLENEKRSSRSKGSLEDEDLIRIEGSDNSVGPTSEELGRSIGRKGLRSGRQVIRRSSMLAKQVISVQSALSLGFVSQLWVDTCSWVVLVVEVRPSLLSGEMERFLLEDVCQIGDVVLIQDENVMENEFKMIGLDTLVGYNVVTPNRRNIGKVRGYTFNVNSGAIESLELDSFGISIIPSSVVSTYALFVEDVLEVASDTVVVHEAAASRVQRLTKGFWDTWNVEASKDKSGEDFRFERQSTRFEHHQGNQKNFSGRNFPSKMREIEEDWELPMDYL